MRMRTLLAAVLATAVIVPLSPASAFQSMTIAGDGPTGGTPGSFAIGDITHVANIPYTITGGNGGGSDIEFGTFEVTKLSNGATGDPVCATDAEGRCLTDENGDTIFETEERDFAFLGRLTANGFVVDITNPESPVKVAEIPCALYQSDMQVTGDVLIVAADSGGRCTQPDGSNTSTFLGFATVDVGDPRNPVYLGRATEGRGAHNVTVHPTEPLVYVSNSDQIGDGRVHIFDISDPASPKRVLDWVYRPVMSPHDITFNAEGTRAYLAARTFTHIVNTEDPRSPSLIASIPHEGYLSHQSDPTPDGDYLFVGEELLGGGFDTVSPGGPMYTWDIRDEANPVFLGAFGNDELGSVGVSTSHVYRINPEGTTMAIAWYEDGLGVIDFSSTRGLNANGLGRQTGVGPRVVAWAKMPGADTWSAKMWQERHPGYVFANDIARGFDVFYVPELAGGFVGYGVIEGGHRGSFNASTGVTRLEWESECDYRPVTNGVDGWVQEIPSAFVGGEQWGLTATGTSANGHDLDLYFYDESCNLLLADEDAGTDETGPIPDDTKYVLVTSYVEGGHIKIRLSVSQAQ